MSIPPAFVILLLTTTTITVECEKTQQQQPSSNTNVNISDIATRSYNIDSFANLFSLCSLNRTSSNATESTLRFLSESSNLNLSDLFTNLFPLFNELFTFPDAVLFRNLLNSTEDKFTDCVNVTNMLYNVPTLANFEHFVRCIWESNCSGLYGDNPRNSSGQQSSSTSLNLMFVFYVYLFLIVLVFGLIGNLITAIIMTRRQMQTSINTYLAGLAIFDVCLLVTSVMVYTPQPYCLQAYSQDIHETSDACKMLGIPMLVFMPLAHIFQTASTWTCVAVTVDRFVAVTYPLKSRFLCTTERAQRVLMAIAIFSVVFCIPKFFELDFKDTAAMQSAFGANAIYKTVYRLALYLVVMIIIPLSVMVILNAIIVKTVREAQRERLRLSGRQDRENKITLMVITIIVSFILLNLLPFIISIMDKFFPDVMNQEAHSIIVLVSNFCVMLNSATNFLIYVAMGAKFRQYFIHLFIPCAGNQAEFAYKMRCSQGINVRSSRMGELHHDGDQSGIISLRRIPSTPHRPPRTQKSSDTGTVQLELPTEHRGSFARYDPRFDYTLLRGSTRTKVNGDATITSTSRTPTPEDQEITVSPEAESLLQEF